MHCEEYIDLISGHVDGINSAEDEARLQAHLQECEHCRALLEAYSSIDAILAQEDAEPPAHLKENIMQAVKATPRKHRNKKGLFVGIGSGLILYTPDETVTPEQEETLVRALCGGGRVDRISEDKMDVASAVSGCGPAFVCQFLEGLADGGVACGLPRDKAYAYGAQMLLGTAALMLESGQHPGVMKDQVCSPGGSTIQGVRVLEERALRGAVMDAVIAAFEKNQALR